MAVTSTHVRTVIGEVGSVVLPDNLLEHTGLKPGDEVIIAIEDGHLIIQTDKQLSDQIKFMFSHIPSGVSLADELIEDRHAEFQREESGYGSG